MKPISFNTPMVQALLEGRKTQTRRIILLSVIENYNYSGGFYIEGQDGSKTAIDNQEDYPSQYKKGDTLWVQESCNPAPENCTWQENSYKADYHEELSKLGEWAPATSMPIEAARIFLQVTNVRVERLQDISEDDALAEGVREIHPAPFVIRYMNYLQHDSLQDQPKTSFGTLWASIYSYVSWKANPWVWVYEFERLDNQKQRNETDIIQYPHGAGHPGRA